MNILWIIIIGFVAGIIARLLAPGPNNPTGFILTTVLGIVGAFVATFIGQAVGWYRPGQGAGLIGAIVGALVVLFVWHRLVVNRTIDDPGRSVDDLPKGAFRRATPADPVSSLVGRNTFYGDGVRTIDVGLYKSFPIAGSAAVSLRFEIYNLLNRTQFAFPDNNFNNATFGQILGTANQYNPRTLQAAVRISL